MSTMDEVIKLITPALKLKLFICHSTPVASGEAIAPHVPDHLRHLMKMEKDGVLVASGPIMEGGRPGLRALMIVRAKDADDARRILAEETLHKLGLRTFTVDEWQLNQGRVHLQLDFSDQTGTLT